jgi:hypothetical protein
MDVYVVRWGMEKADDSVECDAIVHLGLDEAREEFSLVDLAEVASGSALARAAAERGFTPWATLERVAMLDEKERPCDRIADWVCDGASELIDRKA